MRKVLEMIGFQIGSQIEAYAELELLYVIPFPSLSNQFSSWVLNMLKCEMSLSERPYNRLWSYNSPI